MNDPGGNNNPNPPQNFLPDQPPNGNGNPFAGMPPFPPGLNNIPYVPMPVPPPFPHFPPLAHPPFGFQQMFFENNPYNIPPPLRPQPLPAGIPLPLPQIDIIQRIFDRLDQPPPAQPPPTFPVARVNPVPLERRIEQIGEPLWMDRPAPVRRLRSPPPQYEIERELNNYLNRRRQRAEAEDQQIRQNNLVRVTPQQNPRPVFPPPQDFDDDIEILDDMPEPDDVIEEEELNAEGAIVNAELNNLLDNVVDLMDDDDEEEEREPYDVLRRLNIPREAVLGEVVYEPADQQQDNIAANVMAILNCPLPQIPALRPVNNLANQLDNNQELERLQGLLAGIEAHHEAFRVALEGRMAVWMPPPPRRTNYPQLAPKPALKEEEAEEVFNTIRGMFSNVKRDWILERAGHGCEVIADFIIRHEDFVPRDEQEPIEDGVNELLDDPPLDPAEEEEKCIVVDCLKPYINNFGRTRRQSVTKTVEIVEYVKHNYSYVKTSSIPKIRSRDPRKVLAVCTIIEKKAMTPALAIELGCPELYKNGNPALIRARNRLSAEQIQLEQRYRVPKDITTAKKEIDNIIRKATAEAKKYTCIVCDYVFSIHGIMTCTGAPPDADSHLCCWDCMKQHVVHVAAGEGSLTTSGGQGVECVQNSCRSVINTARFERFLNRREKTMLAERLTQAALGNIEGIEKCIKCSYGVFMEDSIEVNKVFACGKCRFEYCRHCQRDWRKHCGLSCQEMENSETEAEKRRRREERLTEAVTLRCPRCKLKWAKKNNSGECNKMTCQCGCKFCNICLQGNIDYSHFCRHCNLGPCPENCGKSCRLYEPDEKVERAKREAALRVLEAEDSDAPYLGGKCFSSPNRACSSRPSSRCSCGSNRSE